MQAVFGSHLVLSPVSIFQDTASIIREYPFKTPENFHDFWPLSLFHRQFFYYYPSSNLANIWPLPRPKKCRRFKSIVPNSFHYFRWKPWAWISFPYLTNLKETFFLQNGSKCYNVWGFLWKRIMSCFSTDFFCFFENFRQFRSFPPS